MTLRLITMATEQYHGQSVALAWGQVNPLHPFTFLRCADSLHAITDRRESGSQCRHTRSL